MKCIVKDCQNEHGEGVFFGLLCSPCHAFITKGEGKHSQMYRNTVPDVAVVSAYNTAVAVLERQRCRDHLMKMHMEAGGKHNYYHVAANYMLFGGYVMRAFPNFRSEGMELRDYFAAKAMEIVVRQLERNYTLELGGIEGPTDAWKWTLDDSEEIADMAYALADEMMKAREQKNDY